uniref:Uncharacterized protein n=1 Tax=Cacopsylla melanoneura TaxID=428564 RepID=A0A8D8TGZ4_9HEMI
MGEEELIRAHSHCLRHLYALEWFQRRHYSPTPGHWPPTSNSSDSSNQPIQTPPLRRLRCHSPGLTSDGSCDTLSTYHEPTPRSPSLQSLTAESSYGTSSSDDERTSHEENTPRRPSTPYPQVARAPSPAEFMSDNAHDSDARSTPRPSWWLVSSAEDLSGRQSTPHPPTPPDRRETSPTTDGAPPVAIETPQRQQGDNEPATPSTSLGENLHTPGLTEDSVGDSARNPADMETPQTDLECTSDGTTDSELPDTPRLDDTRRETKETPQSDTAFMSDGATDSDFPDTPRLDDTQGDTREIPQTEVVLVSDGATDSYVTVAPHSAWGSFSPTEDLSGPPMTPRTPMVEYPRTPRTQVNLAPPVTPDAPARLHESESSFGTPPPTPGRTPRTSCRANLNEFLVFDRTPRDIEPVGSQTGVADNPAPPTETDPPVSQRPTTPIPEDEDDAEGFASPAPSELSEPSDTSDQEYNYPWVHPGLLCRVVIDHMDLSDDQDTTIHNPHQLNAQEQPRPPPTSQT